MPEPNPAGPEMPALNTLPPTEEEARKHLAYFDGLVVQVRNQIEAERTVGAPAIDELRTSLARSEAEIDRLRTEIDEAKAQARKRKDEIEEWQRWYEARPDEEKPAALAKLNGEVRWRGEEINSAQARIGTLEAAKLALNGAVEAVKQQISVVESGVLQRPIEEDPPRR